MDRDVILKRRQRSRALLEQRLAAESDQSADAVERRDAALKAFDEATSLLLKAHFPKTTFWSNFERKPAFWYWSARKPSFWSWSE
jgi:hypothetical protein